jgi:two-component system, chemotaxis family, chemotaxis protein CheY
MLRKVLVVDDSELLHKMYDLTLRRYIARGTRVVHAFNGLEALEALGASADIDLILLDVNMPKMSGIEFLRRRREEAAVREIPVIMVTTEGGEDDADLAMREGASSYVTKPFNPTDLHARIEALFGRNGEQPANG